MKAAFGTVENVRKVPSRQIVQVIIELPIESYVAAVTLLDGQRVLVTTSDLHMPFGVIDGSEPEVKQPEAKEPKEKMGPLCSWAVMRCQEPEFQEFMRLLHQKNINGSSTKLAHTHSPPSLYKTGFFVILTNRPVIISPI